MAVQELCLLQLVVIIIFNYFTNNNVMCTINTNNNWSSQKQFFQGLEKTTVWYFTLKRYFRTCVSTRGVIKLGERFWYNSPGTKKMGIINILRSFIGNWFQFFFFFSFYVDGRQVKYNNNKIFANKYKGYLIRTWKRLLIFCCNVFPFENLYFVCDKTFFFSF